MTIIRIGNPSSPAGINSVFISHSKTSAISELRTRGLTRDHARSVVSTVCSRELGNLVVQNRGGFNIEVFNFSEYEHLPDLYSKPLHYCK